ncbi:CHAD domain-containing protein [Arthrobacter antioxidans]|uniref:CYTH and CHAD domain-containing protein n=1 Tax=Arthrobacter antioxidans TaxID=2895818 RepID=UPI001FFE7185|nr:CYTH and CHAD domain-containing protein [Arthrobacter antioxidans]
MEIERKFDVDDDAAVPLLHDLPGVGRVDQPVEFRLEAEYFDTEDLRLASRRITVRRRTGGEDAGWHLKIPAGPDERHEHHEPLGRKADGVPTTLLDLIRVHVRDRALVPVARLTTRRIVHHLHGEDGGVLADLMDDRVQADVLLPAPAGLHWREWEIELVDGSIDLLDAAQARVTDAGARPSAHSSKLERTLGSMLRTVADGRPTPTPDGPAGDVLLAYLHEQLTVLEQQDPQVRQDAPDAVHRMRVATRRVRSVLGTYRSLLEDAGAVRLLREELKWLAGVLGRARDAEVMHARLKEMLADEPADLLLGPVERRVDLELGDGYRKAHARALKALDSERYFRLVDTLESLLAAPALTARAAEPAARVIPELLNRDIRRLRAAVHEARHHPAGLGDHPALHQARKDAKRLRYAAEAAAPVGRKKIARVADAALGIQKILGEHQDSVVTRDLLRRLGAATSQQGENGFTYGRLHALEQVAALRAESRFRREWKYFPTALGTK